MLKKFDKNVETVKYAKHTVHKVLNIKRELEKEKTQKNNAIKRKMMKFYFNRNNTGTKAILPDNQ